MEGVGLLVLVGLLVVIGVPILAIVAFARTSGTSNRLNDLANRVDRLANLDARLFAIDKKLDRLLAGAPPVQAPAPTAAPAPAPTPTAAAAPPAQPSVATPPAIPATPPSLRPAPPPTAATPPAAPAAKPTVPITPAAPPADPNAIPQGVLPGAAAPPHRPSPPPGAAQASLRSGPSFTSPLSASASSKSGGDFEEMIAGHWLNYVGILALAIAVAFFLKYAFDNNWIGPSGRVAIGVGIGTGLFVVSHWLLNRGYTYFSEGIAGLGSFILYLSIWAGWHYYHLFPQNTAFILMILITAGVFAVAVTRDSERIAVLALIGGVLTPVMVSTGRNEETALFSYVAVLGAGTLFIAFQRKWQSLPPIQFAATLFYFWGWYERFYRPNELNDTVFFATVFFILFAALPMARSLRGERLTELEILITVGNACQFLVALHTMLWPRDRWELTGALVALAAVHFVVAQGVPKRDAEAARLARLVYYGLAVSFATLAIPAGLDDEWITVAWAAEGAVLVGFGLRIRSLKLRVVGLLMFGVVAVRLLAYPIHHSSVFFLNARFVTHAFCAAAYVAAFVLANNSDEELVGPEVTAFYSFAIAGNFLFLYTLSLEVWDYFGSSLVSSAYSQELALSILWVAYALALMVLGVRLKSSSLRWQALILLGVAIVKVFFFDLSFLTRFYRIISFFVLGLVLLLVSFFYQKKSSPSPKS